MVIIITIKFNDLYLRVLLCLLFYLRIMKDEVLNQKLRLHQTANIPDLGVYTFSSLGICAISVFISYLIRFTVLQQPKAIIQKSVHEAISINQFHNVVYFMQYIACVFTMSLSEYELGGSINSENISKILLGLLNFIQQVNFSSDLEFLPVLLMDT